MWTDDHRVSCHMRIDTVQTDSNSWEIELVHMWENGKKEHRE